MVIHKWEGYSNHSGPLQGASGLSPTWAPQSRKPDHQPEEPALGRGAPTTFGFEKQQGLHLREMKGHRKMSLCIKRPTQKLPCSKLESRGRSLKSAWVTREGVSLTNIRASAGRGKDPWELSLGMEALVGPLFLCFFCYALLPPAWPSREDANSDTLH